MFTSWFVLVSDAIVSAPLADLSCAASRLVSFAGPTPRWSSLASRPSMTFARPARRGWTTWNRLCSPRHSSTPRLPALDASLSLDMTEPSLSHPSLRRRYHYLLQSPPDLLRLDDYVLNTGQSPRPLLPMTILCRPSGRCADRSFTRSHLQRPILSSPILPSVQVHKASGRTFPFLLCIYLSLSVFLPELTLA